MRNTLWFLFIPLLFVQCGNGEFFGKKEGKIVFDVTFPYEQPSIKMTLYPTEMICYFNGKQQHSVIESAWGMVKSEFIIDHKKKEFHHLLTCMGTKQIMSLNEQQFPVWINQFPAVELIPTDETLVIAGYECKKTIAKFNNDSLPFVDLYSTTELHLDGDNWWNTYAGVEGTLLGYDVEQYGKRMQVRAREIVFEELDPALFQLPTDFISIGAVEMKKTMDGIVNDYLD
jgi:hypothetical protein